MFSPGGLINPAREIRPYLSRYERHHLPRRCRRVFCRERSLRAVLREALAMETIVVSIIALLLFAYLFVAMIRPEKF
jgi:K+-transporting ATPase KdpF subunit